MAEKKTARELIPVAADRFGQALHAVPVDRWDAATPCSDWSVRELVNHVVAEHLWAPPLLEGRTVQEVGDRFDGDVLGDDPVGAWDRAVATSLPAFASVADDRPVHLSFGTVPADEYANQMLVDLTVHCWDLARGSGLSERLDRATVERSLAYARLRSQEYASSGLFAAPVDTASGDPQDLLLALLGRDPRSAGRG
jgi:uncharacterized protein (TIGR03086 family)